MQLYTDNQSYILFNLTADQIDSALQDLYLFPAQDYDSDLTISFKLITGDDQFTSQYNITSIIVNDAPYFISELGAQVVVQGGSF